jgi:hypothetical protein
MCTLKVTTITLRMRICDGLRVDTELGIDIQDHTDSMRTGIFIIKHG